MQLVQTRLPGVTIVQPAVHEDDRGSFVSAWDRDTWAEAGIGPFVQSNVSRSGPDVLRGLHYQRINPQGKLLTVLAGAVWDVAVDIRPDSPTCGEWVGVDLSAETGQQIWVPPGFAHGFCVVRAPVVVQYFCTTRYDPDAQGGIRWDDPDLGITWPVDHPHLSDRDRSLSSLAEVLGT